MVYRGEEYKLGRWQKLVEDQLKSWDKVKLVKRIWDKDGTVWIPDGAGKTPELTNRLDWLSMPELMQKHSEDIHAFAREIKALNTRHIVLLGMGGSSLAPEVFMTVFGCQEGYPQLIIQDSTHPDAVKQVENRVDLNKTIFLVSSKSGGTLETLSSMKYFYERMNEVTSNPGQHFVAITDPGSKLESIAADRKFRRVFSTPPNVGGRFSALTPFGLVPAALIGLDVKRILERADAMSQACREHKSAESNPGLHLGAVLGVLANQGCDKLTLITSPSIKSLGAWVEQLIAESTGKKGHGILPVADEPLGEAWDYAADRYFIYITVSGDNQPDVDTRLNDLAHDGFPVVHLQLEDPYDIGGEFFRWEMATAAAGAVLGINPFDQPDVEAAKAKARLVMDAYSRKQEIAHLPTIWQGEYIAVVGEADAPSVPKGETILRQFFNQAKPGEYVAIMAYLPSQPELDLLLESMRMCIRQKLHLAVTTGYGPRFLHSTGQLHKGDDNKGLFIQITHSSRNEVKIPGEVYTFNVAIAAQAQGDYEALKEKKRRIICIHIQGNINKGMDEINSLIQDAFEK